MKKNSRDAERFMRVVDEAFYISNNNSTVRGTAKKFGVSKSTVHKDLTNALKDIDWFLYNDVQVVLANNKKERHIRGGNATKERYRRFKSIVEDDNY